MSSISITGLNWCTPNSDPLFSDLTVNFAPLRTGILGRNGSGKTTLLRLIAAELTPQSGKITCPPSIGFLPQNQEFGKNTTIADLFGVQDQLAILARAQAGMATVEDLEQADWTLETRLQTALASLGLDHPPATQLQHMSGGERTRASLAALIYAKHDALLLDEPTNHLDHEGRQYVIHALRAWRGCVLVASHDRTLLEEMDAILELTHNGAQSYGGNYSAFREMKDAELSMAQSELSRAERSLKEIQLRTQRAAERKARTEQKGKKYRASGSQSKLLLDAAKEKSENSGASAARLHQRQSIAAKSALEKAKSAVEKTEPLLMDIPPSGLASGREVLHVHRLRFGYDTGKPVFKDVSFTIRGPERIAITGANGAGKSTLLACLSGQLQPQSGSVALKVPAALIDQDLNMLHPDETIRTAFARLDPQAGENKRRAILARFLFRGADAEQRIGDLSGGQRMRAGLACTLGHSQTRQLLLLDEPSNHLDIEALETLEAALNAYDGAFLIVSHDQTFLERIAIDRKLTL